MTSRFKSIARARRRGHIDFATKTQFGKTYITGVRRRAKAHRDPDSSYHTRLNDGSVQRFIPYGL